VATWLLEETVVNALTSSILTPEYLRQSLEDAQRAANERRPGLDGEIGALEREVADKEASVRGLLQLIQKQGLSPLLEDEYQRANLAWSTVFTRLANAKKEADQLEAPQLSEAEIQAYIADMRGILQTGTIADRQELLRRFIHSVVLYPSHVEVAYNFGPTTLAPLGNFGVPRSPIEGAPREERSKDLSILLMCSSHRVGCNVGRKTLMPALIVIRPSVHIGRMGGVSDVMIAGASVPDEVL
jgi:hypothetical protein